MDDLCGNLSVDNKNYILDIAFINRIFYVLWKLNFAMRFVLFISQCGFLCIEPFSVCVKIPPRLLIELPDHDQLAYVEALCVKVQDL